MKRKPNLLLLFYCIVNLINAQDIILKTDGTEIQAKVTEIGTEDVKYHRFDNQTGPVYNLKKSEIFMITYQDGSKDVFGKKTQTVQPVKPSEPVKPVTSTTPTVLPQKSTTTPQIQTFENARQGDIIEINGVKAIVYQTYGNGHGKAMAVQALRGIKKVWGTAYLSTPDRLSGRTNTENVFRFINERNLNIVLFPVFNWCKSLGDGWYIPSVSELEAFVNFWMGNATQLNWDDDDDHAPKQQTTTTPRATTTYGQNQHTKKINRTIVEAGGVPFSSGVFSSTETGGKIYVFDYKDNKPKMAWQMKKVPKSSLGTKHIGRAFFEY